MSSSKEDDMPVAGDGFDYTGRFAVTESGMPSLPSWMTSLAEEVPGVPSTSSPSTGADGVVHTTKAEQDMLNELFHGKILAPGAGDDSDDAVSRLKGFRIQELRIRTLEDSGGSVVWKADNDILQGGSLFEHELVAHLPARVLRCRGITRQVTFYSRECLKDLYMIQRVFLGDQVIETHDFAFGFVIPNSTNSWEQLMEADTENMLPAEALSGQLSVETRFYDKDVHISTAIVRIFYDP